MCIRDRCNCCLGNKTLHPLVSAIDLSKANVMQHTIKFDFYTLLLLESECCDYIYGRKYYDYSNATLLFLAPGASIDMNDRKVLPQKGWLLAFHPDFLCNTSLEQHVRHCPFFFYSPNEALHLSLRCLLYTSMVTMGKPRFFSGIALPVPPKT